MISKELLSEVLNSPIDTYGIENKHIEYYEDNMLCVWYWSNEKYRIINIYELAYKCKEWL